MRTERLAAAALALAPFLAGCFSAQIMPKYRSRGLARAEDPSLPPIYVQVPDEQASIEYHGYGATQSAKPTEPLSDFLRKTVVAEIQTLGMPVATSPSQARGLLNVAFNKLYIHVGGLSGNVDAEINWTAQLRDQKGKMAWVGEFNGKGHTTTPAPGFPKDAPEVAFNEALTTSLDKFAPTFQLDEAVAKLVGHAVSNGLVAAPKAEPVSSSVEIDTPPESGRARKGYAVVIGVELYRERLPAADFAARDAKLVGKYASAVLGFPEENVVVLTNQSASKTDFEKYIERWLPNRVEKDDEVFVYYSGHGAPDPKSGASYLVPYDGDPTYLDQTAYPVKRLYDNLAKLPAKKITVALDSCFSGAGGRSLIAKGARPLVTVQQAEVPSNVTVLSAAAGDQISNSYDAKGHGLFTYFLLKGLHDKGADLRGAFAYAKIEVQKTARQLSNSDQEPQWRGAK